MVIIVAIICLALVIDCYKPPRHTAYNQCSAGRTSGRALGRHLLVKQGVEGGAGGEYIKQINLRNVLPKCGRFLRVNPEVSVIFLSVTSQVLE